jgi:glycerophosphoryl diester phosphodiesterase
MRNRKTEQIERFPAVDAASDRQRTIMEIVRNRREGRGEVCVVAPAAADSRPGHPLFALETNAVSELVRSSARLGPEHLIAHRGWPARFAENTLAGYQNALTSGAVWFETDLQIADDGECWLFHDVHLERLCRMPGTVFELDRQAAAVEVGRSQDEAGRREAFPMARLSQLVQLMRTAPGTTWFWELKPETVARHGNRKCFELLSESIEKVQDQVVLISFELTTLSFFRRHTGLRLGAVLREPDPAAIEDFSQLEPEFLFCDQAYWEPASLQRWSGAWEWAVYTINDPARAEMYLAQGARLIETDDIGRLLAAGEGRKG